MSVQKTFLALAAFFLAHTCAYAGGELPRKGDIYIISRDDGRMFRGSHRIYNRKADGLVEVQYCGRSYWVRYATVAWTQVEVENEYVVKVEHNWGKGWRPICEHPEEQVTLKDLGISEDPRLVMYNDGPTVPKINRFAAIRKSFKTAQEMAKSYHDK